MTAAPSSVAVALRVVLALARADYLQRVRRYAFLVTLGITVWFAYVALPPNRSVYSTLRIADTRGLYSSAYVGALVAMLTSIFLSLAGFYLVKNSVERDRRSGVGLVLAATPITRVRYTLGKAMSNFAVLATIVAVVAMASAGMQVLRGEDPRVDVAALLVPHLFVTLPVIAVVAAIAVLFETIPFLAGGIGNASYYVLVMLLWAPTMANFPSPRHDDLLGTGILLGPILEAQGRAFPELRDKQDQFSMGFNFKSKGRWDLATFRWDGVAWQPWHALTRLRWLAFALVIATVAALPFDRFDPARARGSSRRVRAGPNAAASDALPTEPAAAIARAVASVTDLAPARRGAGPLTLVLAELRLMLRGVPRAWSVIAIGLAVACWLVPLPIARAGFLPAAWIWPLLLWSSMGAREQRYGVAPLLWSAPHPVGRQLAAVWISGAAISVVIGLGVGARLAFAGDGVGVAAWATGALFIPSFALALGVWSGGGKLFEVLYPALWYVGPLNRVPVLDYFGFSPASAAAGAWRGFAVASAILLAFAVIGRQRQVRP